MERNNSRLLAAVMFTDIVGYTATMQDDEVEASRQKERHRKVLEKRASEFEGRIQHFYGDGALTIFKSAYNAVMCSIRIQKELGASLPLRIGIDMGDIGYNKEDVFGDAVNIAARLESLSVSGGVLISQKVTDELSNHPKIKAVFLGAFELKNVRQPVKIFAVSNKGLKVPSAGEIKKKAGRLTNRIAVLPFVNMSDEIGFDYFCDGLTEEIINGLVKMKGIDVISRTSAFSFKGINEDVRCIGEKLAVSHVLEGSVRKYRDKIRVTAQLIETGEGFHEWSETYDCHLKDIFEIQDTLCKEILQKFQNDPKTQLLSRPSKNSSKAYELYLEGRFHWSRSTVPSIRKATKSFEQAINEEPNFAKAYVDLANCYLFLGIAGHMSSRLAFEKAEKNVKRALLLNEMMPELHAAKGLMETFMYRNFSKANRNFARALEWDSDTPQVQHFYSLFLQVIGKAEESIKRMESALEVDPLNMLYNAELGKAYYFARRYKEALEQYSYTLKLDSSFLPAIDGIGWTYVVMGDYQNAHKTFESYQNLVSQEQKNIPQLVYLATRFGLDDVAKHFLDVLQLGDGDDEYMATPLDIARILLGLGKVDEVFFHLQRAADDRIGKVLLIPSDPFWDCLKNDMRYQKLKVRLGLSGTEERLSAVMV